VNGPRATLRHSKRIVLATIGSLGDLHPLIAIGLVLRGRGHDVVVATTEIYRAKIQGIGFEFHALRPYIPPENEEFVASLLDTKRGPERLIREVLMPALRETYDDLHGLVRRADFMLAGEIVYAAPLAAEKASLPWATYITAPMSFFSAYDPPVLAAYPRLAKLRRFGPKLNLALLVLAELMTRAWSKPVRSFRRELGLPPAPNPLFGGKYSPFLTLAGFSPLLAQPQPDWPPHTLITGFTFYDGEAEGAGIPPSLQAFLKAGSPPIVFTLGSAEVHAPGCFFEESARAAQMMNRRAVLLTGDRPPPSWLPNDVIAVPYVPFSQLFPRASITVHQGGIGTAAQALSAGRPMLVAPWVFDQPDNAARLERLGTSRTIHRTAYKAERVVAELALLTKQARYAQAASQAARVIQGEDGAGKACDAIERQMHMDASTLRHLS
jgi:UDP:flavonoid glycosyltransferase YjiC (YdhE family)